MCDQPQGDPGRGAERQAVRDAGYPGRGLRADRGRLKNLTDYGAFVDLGGLDGLLHITV